MKKSILLVLVLAFSLVTEQTNADFTFGERTNLGPRINSSVMDDSPSVSTDCLELYFLSNRPGWYGHYYIWVTIRPTTDDPWGMPANLGPVVNSSDWEVSPDISADGLSLYFDAWIVDRSDIWVAERAAKDQPWGTPVKLGPNINRVAWQVCPSISPDGLQLYLESGGEIWFSTRQTQSEAWQPAGGRKTGSLQFDGLDDYIATDFVLDPSLGAFSVFVWIKSGSSG